MLILIINHAIAFCEEAREAQGIKNNNDFALGNPSPPPFTKRNNSSYENGRGYRLYWIPAFVGMTFEMSLICPLTEG